MTKINLVIYEGAMCCSTGVCGPEPNKELIELNEALKRLQKEFKELNAVRALCLNMSLKAWINSGNLEERYLEADMPDWK